MALLERINSMQQQGLSEAQIVNNLSEEGVPPLQINEALSQLKIKAAVSSPYPEQVPSPQEYTSSQMPENQLAPPLPAYPQQAQQQESYPQDQYSYPQQNAYPEQGYQEQQYAPEGYYQQTDLETIKDVSKQIVEESLKKIKEELANASKMKSDFKFELQDIENRLVKIENIIQELQTSIIRKMGQYGESIAGISEEIKATQDSFAKVINPLLDKKRGIESSYSENENSEPENEEQEEPERSPVRSQKQSQKSNPSKSQQSSSQESSQRASNSAVSFEDYFR